MQQWSELLKGLGLAARSSHRNLTRASFRQFMAGDRTHDFLGVPDQQVGATLIEPIQRRIVFDAGVGTQRKRLGNILRFNPQGPEEPCLITCGRKPPQPRRRRHARAGLAAEQQRVRKMVSCVRLDLCLSRISRRWRQRGKSLLQPFCHATDSGRGGPGFVLGRHISRFQCLQRRRETGSSRSQVRSKIVKIQLTFLLIRIVASHAVRLQKNFDELRVGWLLGVCAGGNKQGDGECESDVSEGLHRMRSSMGSQ